MTTARDISATVLSSRGAAYRALADAEERGILPPERIAELRAEMEAVDARALLAGVPTKPLNEMPMDEYAAYRQATAGRR